MHTHTEPRITARQLHMPKNRAPVPRVREKHPRRMHAQRPAINSIASPSQATATPSPGPPPTSTACGAAAKHCLQWSRRGARRGRVTQACPAMARRSWPAFFRILRRMSRGPEGISLSGYPSVDILQGYPLHPPALLGILCNAGRGGARALNCEGSLSCQAPLDAQWSKPRALTSRPPWRRQSRSRC